MNQEREAIVTVAFGHSTENLDYTFQSFQQESGPELHAFILGEKLPDRRLAGINYHLVPSVRDFQHPLREVYFRRMELIDQLGVEYALVVDSYDVLRVNSLPPLKTVLA